MAFRDDLLICPILQIKDIEAEMAKTQKNKATSYHLGMDVSSVSISGI